MSDARTRSSVFFAVILYVASLSLPAYESPLVNGDLTYSGYDAFRLGLYSAVRLDIPGWDAARVILCAGWAANPCIWSAVLFLSAGYRRTAAWYAGIALVTQLITAWEFWSLVARCPGFWCWVGCPVWLLVTTRFAPRPQPKENPCGSSQ